MAIDSHMQEVLDVYADMGPLPIESLSPANARNLPTMADAAQGVIGKHILTRTITPVPMPVGKVHHITIPGPGGELLARVYTPPGDGPFPVLVYFHGGGWVIANLDTYDSSCRALTDAAGCIIVSVAYRQAPENPFPAAMEDAVASYQWVLANAATLNGDPLRVAIGGESAGGNLAAVVTLAAREQGFAQPVHQLLVYPVTNYGFDSPSFQEHANAKPLNKAMMQWFWQHYLGAGDGANPYVSPLQAASLQGLPPATIILAGIDPLRSDGEAYANRLREAGIPVSLLVYEEVTHEFFGMAAILDQARLAIAEAAKGLKQGFER